MYTNAVPIGGKVVATEWLVGLFVLVDLIKFCILPILFISLQSIRHPGSKCPSPLGYLNIVISVN